MSGWIKIHRSLLKWEWYSDDKAVKMLIHLNLRVNIVDKKWQGIIVKAGSIVLSWRTLSEDIGYSVQQCRTLIRKLESSGELTKKATNKYQVITLVKWEEMQSDKNKSTSKSTNNQQTTNNQSTTTKEYNNIRIKELYKTLMSEIKISDVDDNLIKYFKVAELFRNLFVKNLKEKNSPTTNQDKATFKNYVSPIRLMYEKDKVTKEQIEKVYTYLNSDKCEQNGFSWKVNILSTAKLREKFEALSVKANLKENQPTKAKKGNR
jgi:DNA-binding Lrp family transcriptional regulator